MFDLNQMIQITDLNQMIQINQPWIKRILK